MKDECLPHSTPSLRQVALGQPGRRLPRQNCLTVGWANSVTSLAVGGDTVATRVGLTPTGVGPMRAGLFHASRRPVFATFAP